MLLIADSGATKVDWCFIKTNNEKIYFQSKGLNPYNISKETLYNEIETKVVPNVEKDANMQIFFYGSGCGTEDKQEEIRQALIHFLPNAKATVKDDLLGAARACCQKEKGIAAILGTGSNSCIYDGEKVVENLPSLGYVLCDEGAGTNIGKLVLRNYLRRQMPENLSLEFAKEYPGSESDFLNKLYKGEAPNYYLASFARFVISRQDDEYCRQIIKEAFENFFLMQVTQYKDYKNFSLNVVGSVGYHAQEVLKQVAEHYDVKVNRVIKSPLENLVSFHLDK
ncbi:MAG: hypothetical protein IJ180_07110 [Bacteroidales bacterium]|nr:hypothetical protein [Bacteroidales bacterium]